MLEDLWKAVATWPWWASFVFLGAAGLCFRVLLSVMSRIDALEKDRCSVQRNIQLHALRPVAIMVLVVMLALLFLCVVSVSGFILR